MDTTFAFNASDGTALVVHRWVPSSGEPRGVVQISHGAAEHGARYARLAGELTGAGYAVYADDHRGHGQTAGVLERAGIAGPDGWNRLIDDAKDLTDYLADAHPGCPIVILGHSMGSFIVQGYLQRWGEDAVAAGLRGVVLTGTTVSLAGAEDNLRETVLEAADREGRDAPSMDFAMMFLGFNEPFATSAPPSGPTGFEWLSRDHDEVRKYVEDPWCGQPLSNGFVADMAAGLEEHWAEGAEARIPSTLPILVMAGGDDPVGQSGEGVRQLVDRYSQRGLAVTDHVYPGARHEIFNETNRAEVHRDLLAWIATVVG